MALLSDHGFNVALQSIISVRLGQETAKQERGSTNSERLHEGVVFGCSHPVVKSLDHPLDEAESTKAGAVVRQRYGFEFSGVGRSETSLDAPSYEGSERTRGSRW